MPDELFLPDWLQVDSLLPSLTEWKEQSSVSGAIRSRSSITRVDEALEAFWQAFSRCRPTAVLAPRTLRLEALNTVAPVVVAPEVKTAKDALARLTAVVEEYVTTHLEVAADWLKRAVGEEGSDPRTWETAANFVRTKMATVKDRVPPAVGLRWICGIERRRLEGWVQGRPPRAEVADAWGAFTSLPTLELWRYESSGGADKSWTLRSRSQITKVDEALDRWWGAFRRLQRDDSAALLDELIAACRAYLAHKDERKTTDRARKKARVGAARRLLFRAEREKERLKTWKLLLPPRVPGLSFTPGQEVDPTQSESFMELRTTLWTPALWHQRSSVSGKIRSQSYIVKVDEALDEFWAVFVKKSRQDSLVALCDVAFRAALYLEHKGGTGDRVEAVRELKERADEEFLRLYEQWPPKVSGELPPIVNDNDSDQDPEVQDAVKAEMKEIANEVDASALAPLDGPAVSAFVTESIESKPEAHDENLATAMGDRNSAWFGRSRAYAQILHPPAEASEWIVKAYAQDKKWVTRQLAAIQSTSIVNYVAGVSASIVKKTSLGPEAKRALEQKHKDLFVRVVSVADHVARTLFKDKQTSAWKVLETLGWVEKAPGLVMPMTSICTILFACKWKDSKSALICGAVNSYGAKRAVVTGLGLGLSVTTFSEGIYKLVEHHHYIQAADVGGNAVSGGLSAFALAGSAVSIPASAFTIYKSVSTHRALTTMLERLAALQQAQPAVVELIDSSPFFYRLRMALAGKLGRRQTRARIEGVAATASIASSVVGIYAAVAVANAWNPVGWALAGIATLGSVGLLIYKIKHKATQKEKLTELRRKYNIPPFVTTAGEWDRYQMADLVFRAALNDGSLGVQLLAIGYALLFLLFGGSLQEARSTALGMGHVGIMAFIKG